MLTLTLLVALLPPLPPFPSEVRPRDASTAPLNAQFFALGDPAPPEGQFGVAVTVDGTPRTELAIERVGCCVVRADFGDVAEGAAVAVNVSGPAGDTAVAWTAGPADDSAPSFAGDVVVIDQGPAGGRYQAILGVDPIDDTQIGAVTAALDGGALVGATVDGFVLTARFDAPAAGEVCLDVVAVDVAGNASPASRACFTVAVDEPGDDDDDPPPGCASGSGAALWALLALISRRRWRP